MSVDRDRLAQARRVVEGGDPSESNAVYVAYVTLILALLYGIPASRAFFLFVDPAWMAAHLTGVQGVLVVGGTCLGLVLLAYRLGSLRGPVVPDLPYLDHVAVSALDRSLVLRRWWRLSLFGALFAGLLAGVVLGAGMVVAGVSSPWALAPTSGGGVALGAAVAGSWLWGQVRSWPTGSRGAGTYLRASRSLRALHLVGLRTQAARAVTVGGAVLAGDLRAARLDVAAPTTRSRGVRLRAHGPLTVVVARDVLGLRRAPGAVLTGLVLSAGGCWALAHATTPGVPNIVALVGTWGAYLGYGAWSEGLRLQGDNAGTAPLIGLPFRVEAAAHLVAPSALFAAVAVVAGGVVALTSAAGVAALWWPLALTGVVAGTHVMAAFRGLPPIRLFGPGGLVTMALWYAQPAVVAMVTGVVATSTLTGAGAGAALLVVVLAVAATTAYGMRKVRLLDEAHRG